MQAPLAPEKKLRSRKPFRFVVWLMTALVIIIILTALILASSTVPGPGVRSRTSAEIQAMSAALESYKTDNSSYPSATNLLTNYFGNDVTLAGGGYRTSAQILYRALSGQTNFADQPSMDSKVYMAFKRNQVGDAPGGSFVKDAWGNPYGYSTGNKTSYPYNGQGYYDLWSTGGTKGISAAQTNAWFSNWQ